MIEIHLTPRPLLERAALELAATQRGPEAQRIAAALLFTTLTAPALLTELQRLRAGIADLYLLHHWWGDGTGPHPCRALIGQGCQCGADAHNARIAALLASESLEHMPYVKVSP